MPDGSLWAKGGFSYSFWQRYLSVFDGVRIVARIQRIQQLDREHQRVDGENISYMPLPYYLGPRQYLMKAGSIQMAVQQAIRTSEAIIFRAPSPLPTSAMPLLEQRLQPYGVEVVGNPYDVFAPGAVKHPLRAFFRWWFTRQLQKTCIGASAVAYVTERTLQERFKPSFGAFTTHYSSVELSDEAFVTTQRQWVEPTRPVKLVTVGSLEQRYKGTDILLRAVQICLNQHITLSLSVIGDGKCRSELKALAASLGIHDQVRFIGQVPSGAAVREHLDAADIFVLPSRTEGLPRAMLEAMARGLPCIGSTAGGIPELLPVEDMAPPEDAAALAEKMCEVISDPARMAQMSARNLRKAITYREDVLRVKRNAFYAFVKDSTLRWLNRWQPSA